MDLEKNTKDERQEKLEESLQELPTLWHIYQKIQTYKSDTGEDARFLIVGQQFYARIIAEMNSLKSADSELGLKLDEIVSLMTIQKILGVQVVKVGIVYGGTSPKWALGH